ncbi:MAG TPA: hypothetical protein VJY33_24525 [Isosphaeraceae bacterium]|nr:hypothetical protein [Isosphaeraceae bacterium]
MIEVRKLAEEIGLDRSALLKSIKKMGINVQKSYRWTDTGMQQVSVVDEDGAERMRQHYADPRETLADIAWAHANLTAALKLATIYALGDGISPDDIAAALDSERQSILALPSEDA